METLDTKQYIVEPQLIYSHGIVVLKNNNEKKIKCTFLKAQIKNL